MLHAITKIKPRDAIVERFEWWEFTISWLVMEDLSEEVILNRMMERTQL